MTNTEFLWQSIALGFSSFALGFMVRGFLIRFYVMVDKPDTKGMMKGLTGDLTAEDLEHMPTGGLTWVKNGHGAILYGATDVTEMWCLYVGQVNSHAKAQEIVGAVNYRLSDEEYQRLSGQTLKSTSDVLWKRRQYWREYAKKAAAASSKE